MVEHKLQIRAGARQRLRNWQLALAYAQIETQAMPGQHTQVGGETRRFRAAGGNDANQRRPKPSGERHFFGDQFIGHVDFHMDSAGDLGFLRRPQRAAWSRIR